MTQEIFAWGGDVETMDLQAGALLLSLAEQYGDELGHVMQAALKYAA